MNLKYIFLGYQRNASSQRYEKDVFFGMLSARGLTHSIMQNVYFPMVLIKKYSMPNEAVMSSWVRDGVPFGSRQQQEWSINGRFVHAMHHERCNRSKSRVALSPC